MPINRNMNQLLLWLSEGDLRTDGLSNQAVAFVLANPETFDDLCEGLASRNVALRGRVADALEKVARMRPDLLRDHLPELERLIRLDETPMVRFHIVMLLGHLACFETLIEELTPTLIEALNDKSAFVKSWAIASLCIVGRVYPDQCERITAEIASLQAESSTAVRTRARKALALLTNKRRPFPEGWVKNEQLKLRLLPPFSGKATGRENH